MATFTITIEDKTNLPPDQLGRLDIEVDHGNNYIFGSSNFTIDTIPNYSDPEGDNPKTLKILNYPNTSHQLQLNGIEVTEAQEISFTDIISGNFSFVPDNSIITEENFTFNFDIADEGSETFSELEGTVNILINARTNQPPSEVGDGEATVIDNETITFTETMFTSTTPAYSDPESDSPSLLKIISLPTKGILKLNNVDVEANQVISFVDINNGLLTFQPDDVNNLELDNFEFQIADSGSNVFVG
jgi:hypothetical protein